MATDTRDTPAPPDAPVGKGKHRLMLVIVLNTKKPRTPGRRVTARR